MMTAGHVFVVEDRFVIFHLPRARALAALRRTDRRIVVQIAAISGCTGFRSPLPAAQAGQGYRVPSCPNRSGDLDLLGRLGFRRLLRRRLREQRHAASIVMQVAKEPP